MSYTTPEYVEPKAFRPSPVAASILRYANRLLQDRCVPKDTRKLLMRWAVGKILSLSNLPGTFKYGIPASANPLVLTKSLTSYTGESLKPEELWCVHHKPLSIGDTSGCH